MAWANFFSNLSDQLTQLTDTRVFPSQKKPHLQKTFFANYYDHLQQLGLNFEKSTAHLLLADSKLEFAIKEVLAHMNMFDALRDGYDYADEIAGATVVNWLGSAATFGLVALAVLQGAHMLAINVGFVKDDAQNHGTSAMLLMLAAAAVFAITSFIFMKSVISLVSRPIVTAIYGFKPQDVNRFYDQDVADRNDEILKTVGAGLDVLGAALFNPQI